MNSNLRSAVLASAAVVAATAPALAGGFAIREQSTVFQGSSFAGNAAGGALSSMFWNPAALAEFNKGISIEAAASFIKPQSSIQALPGSTFCPATLPCASGNIGHDAVVPASYAAYALSKEIVLGLAMNAPFGLSTGTSNSFWAGRTQATNSDIRTLNFQPTIGINILPNLSVGFGAQIERIRGKLGTSTGVSTTSPDASVEGSDWAYGYTAGVLWKPFETTAVGLGYRSSINHTLEGKVGFNAPISPFLPGDAGAAAIKLGVATPESATLSVRQGITPLLTGLFSVEWTNWSRLNKLDIVCTSTSLNAGSLGAGAPCPAPGATSTLPLGWHDGWMVAGGLEYKLMPALTARTGVAWEKSPVQAAAERSPRLPDNDRIWGSLGMSYALNSSFTIDAAYSHVWIDDGQIDRTDSKGVRLLANTSSSLDIVSVGARIKW